MTDRNNGEFKEISAEKINIVNKDGNLRMSLFSEDNIPDPVINGKILKRNHLGAGILFYNNKGDETGGLIFGNHKKDDGSEESFGSFTFDAHGDDQIIQVNSWESNGKRNYGFSIYDRPSGNERAFMGKTQNGEVSIRLFDSKEHERIRMIIDKDEMPRLEFLDENGKVIYSLPPNK